MLKWTPTVLLYYSLQFSMYSLCCTVQSITCTLHCTVYTVQYTVNSWSSGWIEPPVPIPCCRSIAGISGPAAQWLAGCGVSAAFCTLWGVGGVGCGGPPMGGGWGAGQGCNHCCLASALPLVTLVALLVVTGATTNSGSSGHNNF